MTGIKRLTPRQSRKVNTLVKKECCNCENGNCILLDDGDTCVCPQLISYSLLCKWFRIAVLPLDMSKVSGIGENKLRELMDNGELEYVQNGNRRLIADTAIWDWYERAKNAVKPPAEQGG